MMKRFVCLVVISCAGFASGSTFAQEKVPEIERLVVIGKKFDNGSASLGLTNPIQDVIDAFESKVPDSTQIVQAVERIVVRANRVFEMDEATYDVAMQAARRAFSSGVPAGQYFGTRVSGSSTIIFWELLSPSTARICINCVLQLIG